LIFKSFNQLFSSNDDADVVVGGGGVGLFVLWYYRPIDRRPFPFFNGVGSLT